MEKKQKYKIKMAWLSAIALLLGCDKNIAAQKNIDPACTGKAHEYFSAGFGMEHSYEGKISEGKSVSMVLSCDHRKLSISGAVSQVIDGGDFKYQSGEPLGELADLTGGEMVVSVGEDYNFDSYNDLSMIISNGSGNSAIDSYAIFLYSVKENRFVFSKDLLEKVNLKVNPQEKTISEIYSCGFDKHDEPITKSTNYKWKNNQLVRIGNEAKCP